MKLDSDDFELFGVPRRFEQDRSVLDARWRALQAKVHPDRFVTEGAATQRAAMQWAVRVNEAYERLKNPLQRAAYLCQLAGHPVGAEDNTAMPPQFLMQQMAWREALEEASELAQVRALNDEVSAYKRNTLEMLKCLLDESFNLVSAVQQVRALMFIDRLAKDIDQHLNRLEQ